MNTKKFNSGINEKILEEIDRLKIDSNEKDLLRELLEFEKRNSEGGKNTYNDTYLEILEKFMIRGK